MCIFDILSPTYLREGREERRRLTGSTREERRLLREHEVQREGEGPEDDLYDRGDKQKEEFEPINPRRFFK